MRPLLISVAYFGLLACSCSRNEAATRSPATSSDEASHSGVAGAQTRGVHHSGDTRHDQHKAAVHEHYSPHGNHSGDHAADPQQSSPAHDSHAGPAHDSHASHPPDAHRRKEVGKHVAAHSHDGHKHQTVHETEGPEVRGVAQVRDQHGDSGRTAGEIFTRRMLPILQSNKASSCTECHFGGVELSSYIHDDQATTFAALRDEGLINVNKPDESKILRFIGRHTANTDPLIAKVRQAEFQAFRSWIRAAVTEPELLAAKADDSSIGTELPVEVIRHMRRDHALQSFVENIWSEMGRCINCHSPERNKRQVREHGRQVSWIVPRDPAATLEMLVEGGNIDTDNPDESMVLLKPVGLEDHGGGPKFAVGSRTDKNFRRFLNDYASVVNGKYKRTDQLPKPAKDIAVLTGQHLRIVGLPAEFDTKLLKADIYRWMDDGWSRTPWGTAENPINGERNMWQNMVSCVAPRGSKRAEELQHARDVQLPHGRYLVKIFIDQEGKTTENRDYDLGDAEFYGQVEFHGEWQPGYQPPKIIHAPAPR